MALPPGGNEFGPVEAGVSKVHIAREFTPFVEKKKIFINKPTRTHLSFVQHVFVYVANFYVQLPKGSALNIFSSWDQNRDVLC